MNMHTAFSNVGVTGDFDKNSCIWWHKSLTEMRLGKIVRSKMIKVGSVDAQ